MLSIEKQTEEKSISVTLCHARSPALNNASVSFCCSVLFAVEFPAPQRSALPENEKVFAQGSTRAVKSDYCKGFMAESARGQLVITSCLTQGKELPRKGTLSPAQLWVVPLPLQGPGRLSAWKLLISGWGQSSPVDREGKPFIYSFIHQSFLFLEWSEEGFVGNEDKKLSI